MVKLVDKDTLLKEREEKKKVIILSILYIFKFKVMCKLWILLHFFDNL